MMNGNIIFGSNTPNAGAVPFAGAENGLTVAAVGGKTVLGQDLFEAGDPAQLTSDRYIPGNGFAIAIADLLLNNTVALRETGIQLVGFATPAPSITFTNFASIFFTQFVIEPIEDDQGQLQISDVNGKLIAFSGRQTILNAPFSCRTPLTNSQVGFALNLALETDGSARIVTNRNAGANIIFTLPNVNLATPAIGAKFTFIDVMGVTITIDALPGVTIRVGAVVSPAGGTITSVAFGNVTLQAVSLTEWVATSFVGAWVTP